MENGPDNKPDKLRHLNKLSQKSRQKLLFEAFINYPTSFSYGDRIKDIAIRANVNRQNIYQHARRHDWQTVLQQVVEAQKQEEAFAAALESTAPLQKEVSFTALAAKVKNLSYRVLSTVDTIIDSASLQIQFYANRIARAASEVGGYPLLTGDDLQRVEGYHKQIALAAKQLEPYLKPGAVAQLLATINFSQQLPADSGETDASAFTIASLAAKMRELGLPTAFDRPNAATAGYGPLPDIADPAYGSGTAPTAPPTTE